MIGDEAVACYVPVAGENVRISETEAGQERSLFLPPSESVVAVSRHALLLRVWAGTPWLRANPVGMHFLNISQPCGNLH